MEQIALKSSRNRNILKSVFSWIDKLSAYIGYISAAISLFMTLLITFSVVMRYIFGSPIFWIDEISGYLFVGYISLGIVYATLKESHISCEMVLVHTPMKVQYAVTILGYVLALLVSCVMVYYGTQTTLMYYTLGWKSETTLRIILWPVWAVIPLGFLFFALAAISKMYAVTMRLINTGSIEKSSC